MTLSTHVLDAVRGRPAVGVPVRWDSRDASGWVTRAGARTDDDGRIRWSDGPAAGDHRLVFDTAAWFATAGVTGFYPEVAIAFTVTDPEQHHHVPLLLSPFAYSTYRGS